MSDPWPSPAELLPHRAPAILLDAIAAADADTLTASLRVAATSPYAEGPWSSAVLVEAAAQAAGAHGACAARARGGAAAAPQGYLVGVKDLHLAASVPLDVALRVSVRRLGGTGPLSMFAAEVWRDDALLMRGELSVWSADAKR